MRFILYIFLIASTLMAQQVDKTVPLDAWKTLSYVNAAKNADELPNALLTLNHASYVGLHNTPKVNYISVPTNEGGTVSYGGMFQIHIQASGTYRVALANTSWIDMIQNAKVAKSIAHQGGPKGSGIKKMVDYKLEAGEYTLQLSAGADSTTALMIVKLD